MAIAPEGRLMLDAVATTGASREIVLDYAATQFTITAEITDADSSISAMTVDFQIRLYGTGGWITLAQHTLRASEIAAKAATFSVVNRPVRRYRLNISTLTGAGVGDAVTIYSEESGRK